MTTRMNIAAFVGGFATLIALQSCTTRMNEKTGEAEQHADGCGALRYLGSANVDCRYIGELKDLAPGSSWRATGTCINDSQVACTLVNVSCEWVLDQAATITDCVDKVAACAGSPPEGNTVDPNPFTVNLTAGSTLCDPPGTAAQLEAFCTGNISAGAHILNTYRNNCRAQTDRNMSGATCCLPCPKPNPLPGGAAQAGLEEGGEFGGATYGDDACAAAPE